MKSPTLRLAARVARLLPEGLRQTLYRSGPLARGIRGLLNRAAPDQLTEVEVAAGPLAGARLALDLRQEKTFWLGSYEPELMRAVERFGRPGMRAYDVGANFGYVSLALARRAGAEGAVVAFEPLPANLERLRYNLALNPEGEQVTVVAAAVADRRAEAEFLVHRSDRMGKLAGSAGRAAEYQGSLPVQQVALDEWFAEQAAPPHLVKIDVEGGEALVLRGMQQLLRSSRPLLLIELHGSQAAEQARAELAGADYRLYHMRRGYPALLPGADWKRYVVGLPAEYGRPGRRA